MLNCDRVYSAASYGLTPARTIRWAIVTLQNRIVYTLKII